VSQDAAIVHGKDPETLLLENVFIIVISVSKACEWLLLVAHRALYQTILPADDYLASRAWTQSTAWLTKQNGSSRRSMRAISCWLAP